MSNMTIAGFVLGSAALSFLGVAAAQAEPDLFIRDFAVQPGVVAPGGSLAVSGDVYNAIRGTVAPGAAGAGGNGYMVDVVLSTDDFAPVDWAGYSADFHEDVLLRGGRFSDTADVDFYAWHSFGDGNNAIPADTPPGDYFVCAVVDPGQRVAETDEGNNRVCVPLRVAAALPEQPDFVPEILGIADECLGGRHTVFVRFQVANSGPGDFVPDADVPRVAGQMYIRLDGETDIVGGWGFERRFEAGRVRGPSGFGFDPDRDGRYFGRGLVAGFHVDPEGLIAEADETNNIHEKKIEFPEARDCG